MRRGEQQNHQVCYNRRGGIGNPGSRLADAVSREVRVPELLDRNTGEDEKKRDANTPGHDQGPDGVGGDLEVLNAKDAIVHQQNAQLGPAKAPCVEGFSRNQPLEHHDDAVRVDYVGV